MLMLGIFSATVLFILAALPFALEQGDTPSPPISEIRIHAIAQASNTISLKQPIPLNEQVLWTYNFKQSNTSQFTNYHFKPTNVNTSPYCFDTIYDSAKVKACEYEISRNYFLPEPTTPTQKTKCQIDICTTNITISSDHRPGIELSDITLPLKTLLGHTFHISSFPREYSIRYRSKSKAQFSWKPVQLVIQVDRYLPNSIPSIVHQYIFDILIEATLDAILFPLHDPKTQKPTSPIEYLK
ncbi:hypothetical protein DSO57_1019084 [Entomophthora muscae]|uniref:Uncharacterized protein n=1 Tax=Entomophthora muscae TaxID=34485 RepID=A0ACC2TF39_9FUNG|nr:hypothetical protein DSO57_1019084 [Entomophthora muscae]